LTLSLNKLTKLIPFVVLAFVSCKNSEEKLETEEKKTENSAVIDNDSYSSKITFDENTGWGYQIFKGAKLLINQNHIPAIQGMKGFSSKEKAQKTVDYIMAELKEGIFPPTITPEILDSLNVL
jgi:hypothetical protein